MLNNDFNDFVDSLDEYMKLLVGNRDYRNLHKIDEMEWDIRRQGNDLEVEMGEDELREQLSKISLGTCWADNAWLSIK